MVWQSGSGRERETAIFSGGCFWCMEGPFEELEGVVEVVAGYAGGTTENPDYRQVAGGETDHLEAVRVTYDPAILSYEDLLAIYWRQIDPTDDGGQFADRGEHYRTVIFYGSDEQRRLALQSKRQLEDSGLFDNPIVTRILPATTFYMAEEYHQDYYRKNALQYSRYKKGSGRQDFIETFWKKPGDGKGGGDVFRTPSGGDEG